MAKTIRVIDLLNKIANGEEVLDKIKYGDKIYEYKKTNKGTGYLYISEIGSYYWFASDNDFDDRTFLNDTVEIIEEQQYIDIQEIEELPDDIKDFDCVNAKDKINKLVQAVKQLDNKIKDKE